MKQRGNIFKLVNGIVKDSREKPLNLGSGLLQEGVIASAYMRMSILDLKKLSYLISKIIKLKKETERQKIDAGNLDNAIRGAMATNQQKSSQ